MVIGQWPEENLIDHREHGSCRCDAEHERCDHRGGESRGSPQLAQSLLYVLLQRFQPDPAPDTAYYVFHQRCVAKFPLRFAARCLRSQRRGRACLQPLRRDEIRSRHRGLF